MNKVKLAKLPDRVPVKMTVTLPSELAARLRSYADLYAETYGVREEPAELVPYIVDAFFKADVQFQRAIREKTGNAAAENQPSSPAGGETHPGAEPSTREFRKPRPVAARPAAAEA
jgi:hypothetical protein